MPRRLRTPDALYETRLACCRDCEALQNGTCMQCGCYVEMRAARSDMHCPLTEPRCKQNGTPEKPSALSGVPYF